MADSSDSSLSNNNNSNSQLIQLVPVQSNLGEDEKSSQKSRLMELAEPILAEEAVSSKAPQSFLSLRNMLNDLSGPKTPSSHDIAVLFVHLMILEQGFVNLGSTSYELYPGVDFHYKRILVESQKVPKPFKLKDTLFEVHYQLGPFHDVPCKLIVTIFDSNQLVFNCHISKLQKFYSVMVDVSSYIIPLNNLFVFQHMFNFSRIVKSELCFPMKNDILRNQKVIPNTLNNLPEEMLNYLRTYLNFKDDKSLITCLFGNEVSKQLKQTPARKPIAEIRWSFSQTTL